MWRVNLPDTQGTKGGSERVSLMIKRLEGSEHYPIEYIRSLNNALRVTKPLNYKEATQSEGWKAVMEAEMQALEANETWELTKLLEGKKAIDCKWVYKVKLRPNGEVKRLKANLVARGDRQVRDKGYKHTYSPVAKYTSVRTLIALATAHKWPLTPSRYQQRIFSWICR